MESSTCRTVDNHVDRTRALGQHDYGQTVATVEHVTINAHYTAIEVETSLNGDVTTAIDVTRSQSNTSASTVTSRNVSVASDVRATACSTYGSAPYDDDNEIVTKPVTSVDDELHSLATFDTLSNFRGEKRLVTSGNRSEPLAAKLIFNDVLRVGVREIVK